MKVGVVSDTHMTRMAKSLPKALVAEFRNVDLILHLGDWVSMGIYDLLAELAPVEGIAGNNDGIEIIERFGERKLLTLEESGSEWSMVIRHTPAKERTGMRCLLLRTIRWIVFYSVIRISLYCGKRMGFCSLIQDRQRINDVRNCIPSEFWISKRVKSVPGMCSTIPKNKNNCPNDLAFAPWCTVRLKYTITLKRPKPESER